MLCLYQYLANKLLIPNDVQRLSEAKPEPRLHTSQLELESKLTTSGPEPEPCNELM